ncbi:hypothetical protein JHK82_039578 [Glycine max]|nr:hypothetical protein JHK86_039766 [Glycine max]KAG4965368.1 hypothetical protein JHK85_040343 [Glycine max]KAG5110355.1 hypothetical protein JHK82_039578 [Glycine max]KAG5121640.1 hypothetical protein JHK84_039980 [Glycine max]
MPLFLPPQKHAATPPPPNQPCLTHCTILDATVWVLTKTSCVAATTHTLASCTTSDCVKLKLAFDRIDGIKKLLFPLGDAVLALLAVAIRWIRFVFDKGALIENLK